MKLLLFDHFMRASYCFAVEEYILTNPKFNDEYFLLWNTKDTVMVGRFQNTVEEVNLEYTKAEGIDIIRRNSGGGTIFTDENTWQFSFITWKESNNVKDFRVFTKPIIEALKELGINAVFSGRNDLLINDKKFSGNAQFSYKNRFLHHGSILFDANLEKLVRSISPSNEKIISKGIKSVRERVINIKNYLKNPELVSCGFYNQMISILCNKMETIYLGDEDIKKIEKIEKDKFLSWEWNFGLSPDYNFNKSHRFSAGEICVYLLISKGYIRNCSLSGDFFLDGDIIEFQKLLEGCKYEKDEVLKLFKDINIDKYFYQISAEELLECFF